MCRLQELPLVEHRSFQVSHVEDAMCLFDSLTFCWRRPNFPTTITLIRRSFFDLICVVENLTTSTSRSCHFLEYLRTLIFEHFRIHFGLFLPTKTFWSSKRVLTRHQVWDRPPHLSFVFKLCLVHLSHHNQLHNNHDN
jgi:hypothetical protein